MTLALRSPNPELKLFVGSPGSSKTATLAKEIDRIIRTGANPYTLFIAAPFSSGAASLRDRVTKLSGSTRSSRYEFRTFKETLAYQANQLPSVVTPEDAYILDLILGSYSSVDTVPEFLSPAHCIDRACFLPDSIPASIFFSALSRLGLTHPYELLNDTALPSLTADYVFIDDLHLLPSDSTRWIESQRSNGALVFATLDPDYNGAAAYLSVLDADVCNLKSRRKSSTSVPTSFLNNDLPITQFDTIDAEIDSIVSSIFSDYPPEVIICASPVLQAHVLIRSALRGLPPLSPASDSVYTSREVRYLCAALDAVLFKGPAGIKSLLNLVGLDTDKLFLFLASNGIRIGLSRLVESPATLDLPDSYASVLSLFSESYNSWRSIIMPSQRLEAICDWLRSTDQFPQPHLFDIVISEYRREEASLSSRVPLEALHESLLSSVSFDAPEFPNPHTTLVTDVCSLSGHFYPTAHISLTNSGNIEFADEFLYLAVTHTGESRHLTSSPPGSLSRLSEISGNPNG